MKNFSSLSPIIVNPLNANPTKQSNTLKLFVGKLSTNCLRVFDYFALKGLIYNVTVFLNRTPLIFFCPRSLKPFVYNAPFLYPLKASENLKVFWCFQGVEKGCIGNEWVNEEYLIKNKEDHLKKISLLVLE